MLSSARTSTTRTELLPTHGEAFPPRGPTRPATTSPANRPRARRERRSPARQRDPRGGAARRRARGRDPRPGEGRRGRPPGSRPGAPAEASSGSRVIYTSVPLSVRAADEYAYVKRDVRRIALVGGFLIAILASSRSSSTGCSSSPSDRRPVARARRPRPCRAHERRPAAPAPRPSSSRRPSASRSRPGCARARSRSSSARSTSSASAARSAGASPAAISRRSCCGARPEPARRASPACSPRRSVPTS